MQQQPVQKPTTAHYVMPVTCRYAVHKVHERHDMPNPIPKKQGHINQARTLIRQTAVNKLVREDIMDGGHALHIGAT